MSQLSGGKMLAVDIKSSGSTLEAGTPKELFDSPYINLVHSGTGLGRGHIMRSPSPRTASAF
jgi:hypothetical protein